MVPRAQSTHFDDVRIEIFGPTVEAPQFGLRGDAPPERRQTRAEHVGDQDQFVFGADRAVGAGLLADLPGRPDEFGVGVTHLMTRQTTLAVLADEGEARQPMVDRAAATAGSGTISERVGAERHEVPRLPSEQVGIGA